MSGSPKYTTVNLAAQRRAALEASRRQREAERRRRAEDARRRRIAAGVQAGQERAGRVGVRLDELARGAAGLPQQAEVTAARSALRVTVAELAGPGDEAVLKRVGTALREAERAADRLGLAVAREHITRRQDTALMLALAPLEEVTDRARLDPEGNRAVAALTGESRSAIGDGRTFPAVHQRLTAAVAEHVGRVRDRQAELIRVRAESDEVTAQLTEALADADANGVEVSDRAHLEDGLAALATETDGKYVTRWQHRIGQLRRATEDVTAAVEARLDQLDRMAIVVEAASAALPAAGLRVVPGSLVTTGETMTFAASRADGSPIELTVYAGDVRGSRLEYRTDGRDTKVEHTADGTVSRCDLSAELLERFHDALGTEGITTDGLHWAGRPADRPDLVEAVEARRVETRERGR